ncbi:T9SS type A sorting domain-containing protein (plasmid) [Hymenobacter sp. BRD128]|uniref:T9SS type A sorting domain-containing protein n=1 Tax=Hymenobacter sp. BRD128 TaxID=2675878 RepID=UPI00156374B0|nr:T9SS type A sorting domain-containing protein [Hymenobacter sp. BRD128]QKG59071.1 T9SS type A sorting domain-containing protein [Hymenobacter sp. BRD128]
MVQQFALRLTLLVTLALLTLGAGAQTSPASPARVVAKPSPSTTFDQNVANIHWKRGTGTNYVVLIRLNDVYGIYGSPGLIEPDDRPYKTNGNGLMDATSFVPQNPNLPILCAGGVCSTTYLLKTGTYSSAADTTAQVLNTTIGAYYEVGVYEYFVDSNGNKNYTRGAKTTFAQPRIAPQITNITVDANSRPIITFKTAAENATSFLKVQWASDSAQLSSSLSSSFQLAPTNYAGASTYTSALPLTASGPLYYRVLLRAETRPLLAEEKYSKIVRYSPTGRYGSVITNLKAGASASAAAIDLKWTTTNEIYNGGFQLQYAADSLSWQNLGFVNSQVATISTTPGDYKYSTPFTGAMYYRIQQVDRASFITATTKSLLVQAVPLATQSASSYPKGVAAYPNPAHDVVEVFSTSAGSPVQLLNTLGQVVQQTTLAPGTAKLAVQDLPRGVYVVRQGAVSSRLVLE